MSKQYMSDHQWLISRLLSFNETVWIVFLTPISLKPNINAKHIDQTRILLVISPLCYYLSQLKLAAPLEACASKTFTDWWIIALALNFWANLSASFSAPVPENKTRLEKQKQSAQLSILQEWISGYCFIPCLSLENLSESFDVENHSYEATLFDLRFLCRMFVMELSSSFSAPLGQVLIFTGREKGMEVILELSGSWLVSIWDWLYKVAIFWFSSHKWRREETAMDCHLKFINHLQPVHQYVLQQ